MSEPALKNSFWFLMIDRTAPGAPWATSCATSSWCSDTTAGTAASPTTPASTASYHGWCVFYCTPASDSIQFNSIQFNSIQFNSIQFNSDAALTFLMGPLQMLKLYFLPYWVFVMWLDFVTYLHHHGHNDLKIIYAKMQTEAAKKVLQRAA